ncbi:hypothetical protein [Bordetella hinzii]|uniref:hypothetical protein n=1 Tax=Bordetella hinzii TaxID=103855 RepID=UPI00114E0269|nr:hypothetical protein [Bordetella hinzii]QDJ52796.1 hypothetical protein CBR69_21995 [Bordetella hinzii]
MKIFYSKQTQGFYWQDIHGHAIPSDAVEITEAQYDAMLAGQELGKRIVAADDGRPELADVVLTPEAIEAMKVALVQKHMDDAARARRYDNIAAAITYADEASVPRFQAEGRAFRAWRSLVWDTCYRILDQVKAGEREIPTDDELLAELPDLSLPELGT